jgi:hypothetical protein
MCVRTITLYYSVMSDSLLPVLNNGATLTVNRMTPQRRIYRATSGQHALSDRLVLSLDLP